jgi:hypothetical protein
MRVDLAALKVCEDKALAAIDALSTAEKWAALAILVAALGVRLTQVNLTDEKVKAFNRETMKANIP